MINLFAVTAVLLSADTSVLGGYTKPELIGYYILVFFVGQIINWFCYWDVSGVIYDGSVINFIIKPFSFFKKILVGELAWKIANILIYIFALLIIYAVLGGNISLSISGTVALKLVPVLIIGSAITFLMHFLLGSIAFYLTETQFLIDFYFIFSQLLGGAIVPLSFFPEKFMPFLNLTPFRYTFSLPAEIAFSRISDGQYWMALVAGLAWIAFLGLGCRLVWVNGIKKFSAYGQ